jgi:uncharacterized membrane protein YvlD (DUF360 family)
MLFPLIVYVLVMAVAFWVVAQVVPGWKIKDAATAVWVALVYAVLSVIAFWFKLVSWILAIPLMILLPPPLVVWLVGFVITVIVVTITDKLVEDFHIQDLATTVVGCVILGIVQSLLGFFLPV